MKTNNEKSRSILSRYGLKLLIIFMILAATAVSAMAQKSTVVAAFSKNGIDPGMLNPDNVKAPDDYAFDVKQSTTTAGKTNVIEAKFDPASPANERWTVVSVNGKSPSKSDISTFRKGKVPSTTKADDASYKVEKEGAGQLVYSYKLDAASLSKEAAFMKDCRVYMTVNLATKKLEQLQTLNEKPVKIAILTADKFTANSKFVANEETKRYFPLVEEVDIQAKFIGQPVSVQTVTRYSNYTKK